MLHLKQPRFTSSFLFFLRVNHRVTVSFKVFSYSIIMVTLFMLPKSYRNIKQKKIKKYKVFISANSLNPPPPHSHDVHPHPKISQKKTPESLVQNIIVRIIETDDRKLSWEPQTRTAIDARLISLY